MVRDSKKDGTFLSRYKFSEHKINNFKNFKDGKKDGLWIYWYENGQKASRKTYINNKKDGKWTQWYENGQMKSEGTYKDGKEISSKEWNEDGSVKE